MVKEGGLEHTKITNNCFRNRHEHRYTDEPVIYGQVGRCNSTSDADGDDDECQGREEKVDKDGEYLKPRCRGVGQGEKGGRGVHDAGC